MDSVSQQPHGLQTWLLRTQFSSTSLNSPDPNHLIFNYLHLFWVFSLYLFFYLSSLMSLSLCEALSWLSLIVDPFTFLFPSRWFLILCLFVYLSLCLSSVTPVFSPIELCRPWFWIVSWICLFEFIKLMSCLLTISWHLKGVDRGICKALNKIYLEINKNILRWPRFVFM